MSSVTSEFAQVARRVGYFVCTGDVSGFVVTQNATTNSWSIATADLGGALKYTSGNVLEDMGEIAKVNGQLLRKVRLVTQVPAGGAAPAYFIVVPGGEYPIAGFGTNAGSLAPATALTVAAVARLG